MKSGIFSSLAVLFLLVSILAMAAVEDGTVISETSLTPLAHWVEQKTGVAMGFLPAAIASDNKLEKALHLDDAQHAGAAGAYIPGRVIVSSHIWDPNSIVAQSYVLHELVHHAQFLDGKIYACHAEKEREAYMLQSEWLVEHGQKPLVTQAWIDKMSDCGHADTNADRE